MIDNKGQGLTNFIVFILLLAVVLIFLSFGISVEYSFIFILAFILFIISFVNAEFALIIFILSMIFSPELQAGSITGRAIAIRIDDILLFVVFFGWMAKMAITKELGLLKTSALNIPMMTYIFICIVATLLGIMQGYIKIRPAVFYLLKYIEYFLLFFMVMNNLKSMAQAKRFTFFILLTCFLVCIYAWTQIPTGQRISAPFEGREGEPNTFAAYLLLMMAMIMGFVLNSPNRNLVIMYLFFMGFALIPFIYTLSRGGWISFFPMFVAFIFLSRKYKLGLFLFFIAMIILLPYVIPKKVHERVRETFAPETTYEVMGKKIGIAESAASRINAWGLAYKAWLKKPLFGFGVPMGTSIDNQYTRVLGETGALGFTAFFWILLIVFRMGWFAYTNTRGDPFSQSVSMGFLAGFIAILVHSFSSADFILIRVMEPFWFIAAIVAALPELAQAEMKGVNESQA